jgi:hypothetical protein
MVGASSPERLGTLLEWIKGPGTSADMETLANHVERVVSGLKERIETDVDLQRQAISDPDASTVNQLWREAVDRELRLY